MNRRALSVGLAVATLGCAGVGGGAAPSPSRSPSAGLVRITAFRFLPDSIAVAPGDTVVWQNEDAFAHTTTADGGAWSSPEFSLPGRYALVAPAPGRYPYHCAAHPVMRGVLVVRPRP